jgi:hypothetical protein
VYFYPFRTREIAERTRQLSNVNEELRAIQSDLIEKVKDAMADIASESATLPLKRKKKREKPPEDE